MMERNDPAFDLTYDPTADRAYVPDDPGQPKARTDQNEIESIHAAEELDEDLSVGYTGSGDFSFGWRGVHDREYFG
jgi:hypothetical protein